MAQVTVRAKRAIYDDDAGAVIVPADSVGTTLDQKDPPDVSYQVEFTVGVGTVTAWVREDELDFEDGRLGPVIARFKGEALTISDITKAETELDFERRLGPSDQSMKFTFSNGRKLTIAADRNSGTLRYTIT
jgi:hypothetical protein